MLDQSGKKFNRWTVLHHSHRGPNGSHYWVCRCECGNVRTIQNPKYGSKSCGCLLADVRFDAMAHGESRRGSHTPEYRAWIAMKSRCSADDNGSPSWHRYGGRGIEVCSQWVNDYMAFLSDMGRRPSLDHSLDRYPNPDGNYEPGNVRWATRQEQVSTKKKSWPRLDGSMKLRSTEKRYVRKADRTVR